MSSAYLSLAVLLFLLSPCLPLSPPDLLLYDGVSLYSRGDWLGARARMQETLHSLGQLRNIRLQCAALCGLGNSRAEELAWKTGPDSDAESGKEQKAQAGDSRLEETVLGRAHCLSRCEHLKLGDPSLYRLTRDTEQLLHRGAPYNYLQLVHYKLEELDEAAAAAFTFYTRNPKHEQIQTDVKRYRHMRGVREKSFRDLEEPRHRTLYSQAVTLLSEGRAGPAVSRLEESLVLSLSALEECRTLCEGTRENENETHRDLPEVIAEYYVQVLQCKQHCVLDDSVRLGPEHPAQDVILSQLSLLEEAYTKLGDLESAALAAHLLQLFHQWSKSEEPQGNTEEPQGNTEEPQGNTEEPQKFVGKLQKNITSYIRRALAEKKLLYYSMENLGISFHDPDSWTPDEIIPESIKERVRMEREARAQSRGDLPYDGVSVTMTPAQMNGTRRVALDGVISEEDCQGLLIMAQRLAQRRVWLLQSLRQHRTCKCKRFSPELREIY